MWEDLIWCGGTKFDLMVMFDPGNQFWRWTEFLMTGYSNYSFLRRRPYSTVLCSTSVATNELFEIIISAGRADFWDIFGSVICIVQCALNVFCESEFNSRLNSLRTLQWQLRVLCSVLCALNVLAICDLEFNDEILETHGGTHYVPMIHLSVLFCSVCLDQ